MVQPPEQRTPHMPWPTYPMVLKTTSSHEEGVDRSWGINTKEFLGDADGNLRALKVTDVSWEIDVMGRPIKFNEVEGSEREIPCQSVPGYGFCEPAV
jgi:glutamate synthase (NADPH/NADH) small chain